MIDTVTEKNITKHLQGAGFSVTLPRIGIYQVLSQAKKPLKVGDICNELEIPVDQATVYRTLDSFAREGLVAISYLGHGHVHYSLADATHHTHHVVCRKCGHVENISDCVGREVEERVQSLSQSFARIDGHTIEVFGVCNSCSV